VRAVLERAIYRGVVEYGRTRKRDAWGQKKISARSANDLVRVDVPQLRIVSEDVAVRVDAIRRDRRERYLRGQKGHLLGRPTLGKFMLSGMLRCHCGGNYELQRAHGWRKVEGYCCSTARRKGLSVCGNTTRLRPRGNRTRGPRRYRRRAAHARLRRDRARPRVRPGRSRSVAPPWRPSGTTWSARSPT
jgi:hypothetical protein